ncbi:hypothetical protein KQI89_11835 [Clostridium sp. MSJ-4]|uniref:Uncharacterized protein n=1 Tax=Clostridium simiarum TaxID=2841506 RepID=A0ABS6F4H0_9CLOT|nr:hypothetical protein [Clostridium simiarum]MBU5592447.1 hypothetical protein [Clostridium simiarum]
MKLFIISTSILLFSFIFILIMALCKAASKTRYFEEITMVKNIDLKE